eukprot:scaffold30714_cov29-Tisochrysis_lutea.AAC.1
MTQRLSWPLTLLLSRRPSTSCGPVPSYFLRDLVAKQVHGGGGGSDGMTAEGPPLFSCPTTRKPPAPPPPVGTSGGTRDAGEPRVVVLARVVLAGVSLGESRAAEATRPPLRRPPTRATRPPPLSLAATAWGLALTLTLVRAWCVWTAARQARARSRALVTTHSRRALSAET